MKTGIKSQLFKFSSMRAETIAKVRERVFKIIRGKKLVGYHLPQKMVDFGLLESGVAPETHFKDGTNTMVTPEKKKQPPSFIMPPNVPNAISPKKQ